MSQLRKAAFKSDKRIVPLGQIPNGTILRISVNTYMNPAIENDAAPIAATHTRPVQYPRNHAYRQEAPTRLPRSFLAEGPRASRALSASRASSSLSSTGSSPAWPSPCRGRPSGRRGRTRRAIIRACGLWPARRWASSACSCASATSPLCRDAWWPGRCSRRAPCAPSSTGSPGPPCPCALGSL